MNSSYHARSVSILRPDGLSRVWVSLVLVAVVVVSAGSVLAGSGFSDLDGAGSHRAGVEGMAGMGVFEGTECGSDMFCPHEPVERWVMAVWLVRVLEDTPPSDGGVSRFVDVDDSLWWAPYVERLAVLGVTAGCATDPARYCPSDTVTRAQMATFLTRAFDLAPGPSAGFVDVAGGPHQPGINALAASGVTVGCATNPLRFCPTEAVTRAQMATFLTRALDYTPPKARVAFNRLLGRQLMVMNADGTNPRQLTAGVAWNPVWSPDGTRIAYHSEKGQGIWVVNADGTGRRQLTTDDGLSPVWSPDGTRVAYYALGVGTGIWVVGADGTGRRQVAPWPARFPVWSPDGTRIAYHGGGDWPNSFAGIWVVDVDGSNRRTLTEGGEYPVWSPDGTRITYQGLLFAGNARQASVDESSKGIWVVDTGGGNNRQLTDGENDRRPLWSPDGSRITYYQTRYTLAGHESSGIYVMNADGTDQQLLSSSGGDPAWSPNGDRIVYLDRSDGLSGQIWVMNADGTDPQLINSSGGDPAWSPDGDSIVYISGDTVGFYVMDPDGANQRAYAHLGAQGIYVAAADDTNQQDPEAEESPLKDVLTVAKEAVWAPDGTGVAYNDGRSLYVVNTDGSNRPHLVAFGCGFIPSPEWSPDSTHLGYEGGGFIVIAEVETGRRVQTVFDSGNLLWSPDSTRIAYTNSSGHGIFVSDIDGTNKHQLATGEIRRMAWSPDGTRIVYTRGVDYTTSDMYVVGTDGTNPQRITTGLSTVREIAWSPDSTQVAYMQWGDGIYAINADGTNRRNVAKGGLGTRDIAWSPDSSRILYTVYVAFFYSESVGSRAGMIEFEEGGGIWVANADGTNQQRLTSGRDRRPVWITR